MYRIFNEFVTYFLPSTSISFGRRLYKVHCPFSFCATLCQLFAPHTFQNALSQENEQDLKCPSGKLTNVQSEIQVVHEETRASHPKPSKSNCSCQLWHFEKSRCSKSAHLIRVYIQKKKKKQINTDLGGQDDQTAQRSRLESGTKKLPVPFRQCLARIYYVCICFISPPTSRLLTLNAGYVCKQPEKCQFQAYSSAPFICQLCLTFQKQATAEIISCPFQHQLKLNDVKYGKLHRRKFRRNYQVPYSLLMGLNCALGSNRRLRGAAKSWKKLSLT